MHCFCSRRSIIAVASVTLVLLALCCVTPCLAGANSKSNGSASALVDINQASEEQLMTIPGIGKVTAERIVQFRKQHGSFERVEDLLKIKGIGEKSFQKIRPYVKVGKSK